MRLGSGIVEPHGLADVFQRVAGNIAGGFAALVNQGVHTCPVRQVFGRTGTDRVQFRHHGIQQPAFAVRAADAGTPAAFLHPSERLGIGINLVQVPDRTFSGSPGSLRRLRAGSVIMPISFFWMTSGSSRKPKVLL